MVRDSLKGVPKFTAEELPMASMGGSIVLSLVVFISYLVSFVCHMFDMHEKAGAKFWHQGIPSDQVWIKFGGDHGGHSFKLCCQILNVHTPNSTVNTIPICLFAAKDVPANLETAVGQYRAQLIELAATKWKGKILHVLLSGNYEYLTTNFELSGSSGVRPCLFCLCKKKEMQNTLSEPHPSRSNESMQQDHTAFLAAGGNLSRAKHHNNAFHPASHTPHSTP